MKGSNASLSTDFIGLRGLLDIRYLQELDVLGNHGNIPELILMKPKASILSQRLNPLYGYQTLKVTVYP